MRGGMRDLELTVSVGSERSMESAPSPTHHKPSAYRPTTKIDPTIATCLSRREGGGGGAWKLAEGSFTVPILAFLTQPEI